LNAIGAENTVVTMSPYVELTLARVNAAHDVTGYDRPVSRPETGWPLRRIVLVPAVLFVAVSATVFALARLHPAKPEAAAGTVTLGNAVRGKAVFREVCAPCHGANAEGRVGPRLAGTTLTSAAAKAQIDNGGGIMPARLVTGRDEEDVLAYLASIAARG
jgi:mono/diheme cytochrome c family protein